MLTSWFHKRCLVPYTNSQCLKTHEEEHRQVNKNATKKLQHGFEMEWSTLWIRWCIYSWDDAKQCTQNLCCCQLWNIMSMHLHQWAPRAKTMHHLTLPNAFVALKDTTYDHLYIWTPSTVPGPVYDRDYPIDIFIAPWQTSSSADLERELQKAKEAPQCWCETSEFCVEIISLFSCHLGSGCWRVA